MQIHTNVRVGFLVHRIRRCPYVRLFLLSGLPSLSCLSPFFFFFLNSFVYYTCAWLSEFCAIKRRYNFNRETFWHLFYFTVNQRASRRRAAFCVSLCRGTFTSGRLMVAWAKQYSAFLFHGPEESAVWFSNSFFVLSHGYAKLWVWWAQNVEEGNPSGIEGFIDLKLKIFSGFDVFAEKCLLRTEFIQMGIIYTIGWPMMGHWKF